MEFNHVSVLMHETIDGLNIRDDGIYLDGTLGGAGHSLEIAKRISKNGHLYGFDRDDEAIKASTERLSEYSDRVTIIRDNYVNAVSVLQDKGISGVDGILLDIGVSSKQLDDAGRGFSYMHDAPIDMRMDKDAPISGADIINDYSEDELYRIIRDYGEEKYAKSIAKKIVSARASKRIETTFELNEIILSSVPAKYKYGDSHPSKKTFQAIRIACNDELNVLENALTDMIDFMNENARMCIITFHSLEDRIVKNIFKTAQSPCTCPPTSPICTCGKKSKGKIITRKPITASGEELKNNSRAKSAKLRIFERISTE